MSQVVLYGTRFCPFCIQASRLLNNKGIEFEDIPLDSDPQLRSAVMDRSSRHTVPQIWIGDDHLGGFTELRDLDMQGGLDSLISTGG